MPTMDYRRRPRWCDSAKRRLEMVSINGMGGAVMRRLRIFEQRFAEILRWITLLLLTWLDRLSGTTIAAGLGSLL